MPSHAVHDGRLLDVTDAVFRGLATDFSCLGCQQPLVLRRARRLAGRTFTDHFAHRHAPDRDPDNLPCPARTNAGYRKILARETDPAPPSTWRRVLAYAVVASSREVVRAHGEHRHVVDAYDPATARGCEFQHSPVDPEDVRSRDALTDLDWIFDFTDARVVRVRIGAFLLVTVPHKSWETALPTCRGRVFADVGLGPERWIRFKYRRAFDIALEPSAPPHRVFVAEFVTLQTVLAATCLDTLVARPPDLPARAGKRLLERDAVYGRCAHSMKALDQLHRDFLKDGRLLLASAPVVAVKAVAGAGKTTVLLDLCRALPHARLLYLAYNRDLVRDVKTRAHDLGIHNLDARTFDSLVCLLRPRDAGDVRFTTRDLADLVPWFRTKSEFCRRTALELFARFCADPLPQTPADLTFDDERSRAQKSYVWAADLMWRAALDGRLRSFDVFRKLAHRDRAMRLLDDGRYAAVLCDEAQDFDAVMLDMLLRDLPATPKIFVGDPMQAIYQWRGAVDAFQRLPPDTLVLELYKSFRIGAPAVETLNAWFRNCYMIAGDPTRQTQILPLSSSSPTPPAVVLFRTWAELLQYAEITPRVYIAGIDDRIVDIRKYHRSKKRPRPRAGEEDDLEEGLVRLPDFVRSLSPQRLEELLDRIVDHCVASPEDADFQLSTVHAFKGREADRVVVWKDVLFASDSHVAYVALTRGRDVTFYDRTPTVVKPARRCSNCAMAFHTLDPSKRVCAVCAT